MELLGVCVCNICYLWLGFLWIFIFTWDSFIRWWLGFLSGKLIQVVLITAGSNISVNVSVLFDIENNCFAVTCAVNASGGLQPALSGHFRRFPASKTCSSPVFSPLTPAPAFR